MKIAFYAPMKSPSHPIPSGDRLMARLLLRVLREIASPENVRLASEFRAYSSKPSTDQLEMNRKAAIAEAANLIAEWERQCWAPDVWFTYHPYYKAPDWIGPEIVRRFGCPMITAEASYSAKRALDAWASWHREHVEGLRLAACHLYMKERDRLGLLTLPDTQAELVHLPPFIDLAPFSRASTQLQTWEGPVRLITVAMMRADVKLESYRYLAQALAGLTDLDWTLDIVGDGVARAKVEAAFGTVLSDRLRWHGLVEPDDIPALLAQSNVFVWPGFAEAYGLAYLEAQACGLPVVAQACAGVPAVVRDGETGLLAAENDLSDFRAVLGDLISNPGKAKQLGQQARAFVHTERGMVQAQRTIGNALQRVLALKSSRQT